MPSASTILPLGRLTPDEVLQRHEDLTFPPVARRLAVRPPGGPWSGALAVGDAGPVGLALVETAGDVAQLFSLAVLPPHRGLGVGGRLVAAAEELARSAGARRLEGAYRTSWRSRAAVEALLAARGWDPPEVRLVLARGETALARELVRAPSPALPAEAEVFAWEDLTDAERDGILARQAAERWYPEVLTPFQEEPRLEPTVSVGLRWEGEVAGWLICHRVAFDTLQYSAFFLRPDLRRRGVGWALLHEAVRRRLADPDLRSTIFAVDATNARMRELLDRRLRDFVVATSELRVSGKALDAPA